MIDAVALPAARPWADLTTGGPAGLGHVARLIRQERKLTQEALAAAAGVSRDTVGRLERAAASNPRLRVICATATALRVGVVELTNAFVLHDHHASPVGGETPPNDAADCSPGVRTLPSLRDTGPAGLSVALRALRLDLGVGIDEAAALAGTHVNTVAFIETGRIASPGLLTLTRLVHAIGGNSTDVQLTALRVQLLAEVYATEISAFEAIRRHRQSRHPSAGVRTSRDSARVDTPHKPRPQLRQAR